MISKLLAPDFRSLLKILLLSLLTIPVAVRASGFAAQVSPPRFELKATPGQSIRDIVEIQNSDDQPNTFQLRTADWMLNDQGGVVIHPPALQPDSCRPWARIERHKIRLAAQASKRYRFEIRVPEDAPAGECRLALLLESAEEDALMAKAQNISFPIHGRIAVIIYVVVGDAKADLDLKELKLDEVNGRLTPVAVFHNKGNAHGRPQGLLQGRDASGKRLEFSVSPSPVLPGHTRAIPIWQATLDQDEPVTLRPPLELKGVIEWDGGRERLDRMVEASQR